MGKKQNLFNSDVLTDKKLKKYMKLRDFKCFLAVKYSNSGINIDIANKVAKATLKWALNKGATHYTHRFFPLTNKSCEKLISLNDVKNSFSLIKDETDASSFPCGEERNTSKARGYTLWDFSSQVYIRNNILYIPSVFCSYNDVALDELTPLLRASERLSERACEVLHNLGYKDVKKVICNVGCEQEYFLIDKRIYEKYKNPQIIYEKLFSNFSKMNYYHYFSKIDSKIISYMSDLDIELKKVGILPKIQHKEVAPFQYEIVPVFAPSHIASMQNILLMEIMEEVAEKHNLKVIFNEKPFENFNGSGKHNNWSISTDTGINLLDISKVNIDIFLLFFTSIVSAIDKYYPLLRLSASTKSNDERLGNSEAPPTIISVYVGEYMYSILQKYAKDEEVILKDKNTIDFNVLSVPKINKDNTDRNRTSPFAFTGNKFEFRMLGSNQNPFFCNTVLATILTDELNSVIEKINKEEDKNLTVKNIITNNIKNHSRIIFNGNNYTDNWKIEAQKRGLKDYKTTDECLNILLDQKIQNLFERNQILTSAELKVRYKTLLNNC